MVNKKNKKLFEAFRNHRFGYSICFLCGCRLDSKNRADEHVIPKWVQRRFDLSNQKMYLLNRTTIPYRQLKIPCCRTCNNKYLQPIERQVSQAVKGGAKAVRKLPSHTLFVWLGKIFYGLLYRELLLDWDRSGKLKNKIVTKQLLKQYEMHHLFLQSVRMPIKFEIPASILIVNTQEPADPKAGWDFHDEITCMLIGCRLGTVGIIAVLQDGGAQKSLFSSLRISRMKLHHLQFREILAQVCYKARLFNRIPKYIIAADKEKMQIAQLPLGGFSLKPLFKKWDQEEYAKYLSQFTGFPLEQVFQPPDKVTTWIKPRS